MEINEIISLAIAGLNFLIATTITIINIVKSAKSKNWEQLKETLTSATIPLMEQAEKLFADAHEKENWVVKKVGEEIKIDWFKHKKVLALELDIIKDICATTKIEVNKNIVKLEKEEETKVDNGGYNINGIS